MKTPRFMMGLALLFWGWETGLSLWGLLMAVALEAACWTNSRWEFTDSDLNRICDLCFVLFIGAGFLLYQTEDRLVFVFKFAQWLPFCFFPVAVAQTYGDQPYVPLSAFSILLRRIPHSPLARIKFNVSYGYFAICLLAASASGRANQFFYAGVSVLILLALGSLRPNRLSWPAWITLAAVVMTCGRLSHQELRQLQNKMETALGSWLADLLHSTTDLREHHTSIGQAVPPLSAKIVLRLHVSPGEVPPALLREGAYDAYRKSVWTAGTNEPHQVYVDPTNGVAHLMPAKKVSSKVEIAGYFPDGVGIMPLPHGTFELEDFQGVLRTNGLGVADSQSGPGLLDYEADYGTGPSFDGPTNAMDLSVPDDEKPVLKALVTKLGLEQMNERQRVRAVSRFFQDNFKYSLTSPNYVSLNGQKTALGRFLTETKAGHCEYFATATVLLLRQAKVNARFITGYAVQESARHGDTYLVRERHRHAWALVYHTNTMSWEQIDNTPTAWAEEAEAGAPWWQSVSDFMSNLFFQFSRWRWGKASFSRYAQWALGPLILYLVWRILSTRRQQKGGGTTVGPPGPVWPGLDSELYVIDRRLAEVHLARQPHEPLSHWQKRVETALPASPTLGGIFDMHRRLRFDPRGLARHDRENLRRRAEEWLADFSAQQERLKSSTR